MSFVELATDVAAFGKSYSMNEDADVHAAGHPVDGCNELLRRLRYCCYREDGRVRERERRVEGIHFEFGRGQSLRALGRMRAAEHLITAGSP